MRIIQTFTLVVAALVLVGCGGSGGADESEFIGLWAGDWQAPGFSTSGTAELNVDAGGAITGTTITTGVSGTGTITGSINGDGDVTATLNWPGLSAITASGNLSTDGSNLTGSLTTTGSNPQTVNFQLAKQ